MASPQLFDVHTHTQFAAFAEDQDAVIQRALDQGVWMVNVGTQRDTSKKAVETAQRHGEGVYASVGLHPIHTEKSYHDPQELDAPSFAKASEGKEGGFTSRGEEFDAAYYRDLGRDPKVVAIGECGLDYYRIKNEESRMKQERAFRQQIELAVELQKPLMVHCRNAFADLIKILNSYFLIPDSRPAGVVHFFSGTKADAKKLVDLGFSFSFGGVITFTRDYDEVVRYISLDRILLETDAPYVAPVPYRGKRNEPAYLIETAKKIAELRGTTAEEVATATTENAKILFGLQ